MSNRGPGIFGINIGWAILLKLSLFPVVLLAAPDIDAIAVAANSQTLQTAQLEKKPEPEAPGEKGENYAPTGNKNIVEDKPVTAKPDIKAEEQTYPKIMGDLSKLPFPVRRMHELILEAALSGDIEKLRPLIGYGDDVTMLSLGGIEEDPLNFLKSMSGDKEGHEILAILSEVLESGYVLMDEGSEHEIYVWPYFFAWPLDKLNPVQKVELYRLVTYGDYEDMEAFGGYIFYRLGISPRGRWRFFVAGD